MSNILEEYTKRHPTSEELYREASENLPSGITHDGRNMTPFPLYVERANGARKWDVDGNEIIDYVMGHGSLILGHCAPEIVKAVRAQMGNGTHYGACHRIEIDWAKMVREMVPGAERVRFTSSGTEATLLALRLARTHTGKHAILRFHGHFHGWHDYVLLGNRAPFSLPSSTGLPPQINSLTHSLPTGDIEAVRSLLKQEEIGAVIIEPTGGTQGKVPVLPDFVRQLRDLTTELGVLLIFDEVVTGFRYSPGGAAQYLGVSPDLTALGKILAGGMPGGAVAGLADIMAPLNMTGVPAQDRYARVTHPGTFNANPPSASAGTTCLQRIRDGEVQRYCDELARRLREGMNGVLTRRGLPGCVYGGSSIIHIAAGAAVPQVSDPAELVKINPSVLLANMGTALTPFRRALLNRGVDFMGPTGFVSAAHTTEDIDATIGSFDGAISDLVTEAII